MGISKKNFNDNMEKMKNNEKNWCFFLNFEIIIWKNICRYLIFSYR